MRLHLLCLPLLRLPLLLLLLLLLVWYTYIPHFHEPVHILSVGVKGGGIGTIRLRVRKPRPCWSDKVCMISNFTNLRLRGRGGYIPLVGQASERAFLGVLRLKHSPKSLLAKDVGSAVYLLQA